MRYAEHCRASLVACGIMCSTAVTAARPCSISPATTTPSSRPSSTPALGFRGCARVPSDAEPFSPGDPSPRRRRLGPMGAVAVDGPRPTLSPPLRYQRARLARTIQGVHHSERESSPTRVALRGGNPLRAELVTRAEDWNCSSLPGWLRRDPLLWRGGLKYATSRGWRVKRAPIRRRLTSIATLSRAGGRLAPSNGCGTGPAPGARVALRSWGKPRKNCSYKVLLPPFFSAPRHEQVVGSVDGREEDRDEDVFYLFLKVNGGR